MIDRDLLEKALAQSDITDILVQPEIDRIIAQLVDFLNPIRMNLPRKPGSGESWLVNRRSPGTTAAAFINDTEAIPESTGTYARFPFPYKTIGTKGRVSRRSKKVAATYVQLVQEELEAKAREYRDFEEDALFWADVDTNPKEFDGLHQLLRDAPATQTLLGSTSDAGGGELTLELLDRALDAAIGNPGLILCSRRTRRQIYSLLQAQQRFVDKMEINGGFVVGSYNNIPILASTRIPDTITFDPTGDGGRGSITSLTGGTTSALFVVDSEDTFVGELTPVTVMPVANVSSQFEEFEMFSDQVLVQRHTLKDVIIMGINFFV